MTVRCDKQVLKRLFLPHSSNVCTKGNQSTVDFDCTLVAKHFSATGTSILPHYHLFAELVLASIHFDPANGVGNYKAGGAIRVQ
ncbi:MAG TPA: hypothetical protein VF719_12075 [Abditibacteriaceae bacterium]|jgi:hypothetical protein